MNEVLKCNSCSATLRIDREKARKKGLSQVTCPKCNTIISISFEEVIEAPVVEVEEVQTVNPIIETGNTSLRSKRPNFWVPGIVGLMFVAICILGGMVILQKKNNIDGGEQPLIGRNSETPPPTAETNEQEALLQERVESLKKEVQSLNDEINSLDQKKKSLDQESKDLQGKIKDLLSFLDEMRATEDASFVMVNPAHYAVSVKADGDKMILLNKHRETKAQAIMASARHYGLAQMAHDKELTRKVFRDVEIGEEIPPTLVGKIKKYFRARDFVFLGPNDKAKYLVFDDFNSKHSKMVFFKEIEGDQMLVQGLTKDITSVARDDVMPGSARVLSGDQFLDRIGDADFLDYCLLNVLREMETADPAILPSLACYVSVDVNGKLSPNTMNYAVSSLTDQLTRTSTVSTLSQQVKYLEDEIYAKLSDTSIELLEREEIQNNLRELYHPEVLYAKLINEFGFRMSYDTKRKLEAHVIKNNDELLGLTGATHILNVEVKPAIGQGMYHLSVRLVDTATAKVIWAKAHDRAYNSPPALYFPKSGELAKVELPSTMAMETRARFLEEKPIAPIGRLGDKERPYNPLVLIENKNGGTYLIRSLFDRTVREYQPKTPLVSIRKPDDVDLFNQSRYFSWRIAQAVLPPAGLVLRKDERSPRVQISLGKNSKLKQGDTLNLAKSTPNGVLPIATELVITTVNDTKSIAKIQETGLEELFTEQIIEQGDLAYVPTNQIPIAEVDQFTIDGPINQRLAVKLKWNNSARRARLVSKATEASRRIRRVLIDSLTKLQTPLIQDDESSKQLSSGQMRICGRNAPPNSKITHKITAVVRIEAEGKYVFDFSVRQASTNEVFDRFTMNIPVIGK